MEIPQYITLECSDFKCRNSRDSHPMRVLAESYEPGSHVCPVCGEDMRSNEEAQAEKLMNYISAGGFEGKYRNK